MCGILNNFFYKKRINCLFITCPAPANHKDNFIALSFYYNNYS